MTNAANFSQPFKLQIEYPYNPSYFFYSVASVTGGFTSIANPVPGTSAGEAIVWEVPSMPAFTTYELVFNVSGIVGSSSAENGVKLFLKEPCESEPDFDCYDDDKLHLILVN
jgi:hypothetical protein